MINFIFSQLLFYIAITVVLFVPGYFLLMATFPKRKTFSSLNKFILSFGSSIVAVDFLMIFLGKLKIPITRASVLLVIAIFSAICGTIFYFRSKQNEFEEKISKTKKLSQKQLVMIIAILFLSVFVKTTYLKNAMLPTTTDLGHHMYWAKTIATTGQLPQYKKVDIGANFNLGKPEPIADFIIGEHLIFSAIGLISGIDYISYFPVLILYLIHIMGILTMFSLARLLFKDSPDGDTIAIVTLFLTGPAYALSSPQMKFVSGGVIGNTIGNFLIPLVIYLFVRALGEKSSKLFAYATFMVLGLAYTHHLSTFVFIFVFIFSAIFFAAFNFRKISHHLKDWMKIIFSPSVLSILAFGIIFVFLFYMPTYLNKKAIGTAVGAPSKATRMGLTISQLKFAAGEARMAIATIGIAFLLATKKRSSYKKVFLLGWFFSIAVMSLWPGLLLIDIPSSRIANYIGFPTAILASLALVRIFSMIKSTGKQYLRSPLIFATFILVLTFVSVSGFFDNSKTLNTNVQGEKVLQTYDASKYLASNSSSSDIILKDHNYIAADSWIKLFFMRDYNYPLSRGYFKRYSDQTKPREQCTNIMISNPNSEEAKKCFDGTKTDFLMIDPKMDETQFKKSKEFWQVYAADDISIFYKSI